LTSFKHWVRETTASGSSVCWYTSACIPWIIQTRSFWFSYFYFVVFVRYFSSPFTRSAEFSFQNLIRKFIEPDSLFIKIFFVRADCVTGAAAIRASQKKKKKKCLLCLCKGVHPSINDSILRNRKENEKESTICCGSSRSKKEQEESHMKATWQKWGWI
jgi:hypothetical protein